MDPKQSDGMDAENDTTGPANLCNVSETDIFAHISSNSRVFFKNQQVNDPELTAGEKDAILREVLRKSHCTFLSRFGHYMKDEHLRYFEQDGQTLAYSPDERYEIDHHLERIRRLRNGGRAVEVRNRRFAALQKMCNDGTYFSEPEMMQRDPLLYEQLVGQFMTEREKRERDATVPVPRSVVGILFNQIDKEQRKETLEKLESEENRQEQSIEDMEGSNGPSRPGSPGFPRAQWGNFDDEEETRFAARAREHQKKDRQRRLAIPPPHLVTAGERDLLRDEFIGIMHSRFIAGEEQEFDYTQVDDSLEYDDLDIVEQDEQERYFDEDDEPEASAHAVEATVEDSEDDLDVYMRHLNRHLEQQQKMSAMDQQPPVRDPNCEYDSDE